MRVVIIYEATITSLGAEILMVRPQVLWSATKAKEERETPTRVQMRHRANGLDWLEKHDLEILSTDLCREFSGGSF